MAFGVRHGEVGQSCEQAGVDAWLDGSGPAERDALAAFGDVEAHLVGVHG